MTNKRRMLLILIYASIYVAIFFISNLGVSIIEPSTSTVDMRIPSSDNDILFSLDNNLYTLNPNNEKIAFKPDSIEHQQTGTYSEFHADVIFPKGDSFYCLMVPGFSSDYQLYVNGELVYTYEASDDQLLYNNIVYFYAQNANSTLTIKAKNIDITKANNAGLFLLGNISATRRFAFNRIVPLLLIIAQITIGALHYFALYIYNSRNRDYLTFSLLCLSLYIRALSNNITLFAYVFPKAKIHTYLVFDLLSVIVPLTILIFHIDTLFPKQVNKKLAVPLEFIMLIYIGASLSVTNESLHFMTIARLIIVLTVLLFLIYASTKAVIDKEESSISNLIGILLISAGIILDLISYYIFNRYTNILLYTSSLFLVMYVNMFISKKTRMYNNEIRLNKVYLSTISDIETEKTNFLSSHLRPHFLFNALNIISGYSLFDGPKAKEITKSLTVYLKQLFEHDNLNELNSLSNEMKLVEAFAYIELERFPGLSIIYDIPEKLPNIRIPSLTLQPLLENAINHGVRKKNSKGIGTVIISIKQVRKHIYFSIKDNGAGADEEQINKALSVSSDGKHHSLIHISHRLNKLYKENIKIRSIIGVGTFVSFKIPYESTSDTNL